MYPLVAQLHELIPNGWVNGGQFGNSVAINNTYAIVGEHYGNTDYEGNAYVFDVSTGSQLQLHLRLVMPLLMIILALL